WTVGMPLIDKMVALRQLPLFASLSPDALERLGRAALEGQYAAGEALCREGEPGTEVFLVLSGEVETFRGSGARSVGKTGAGGLIGELAVLDPAPRAATVRAGPDGARALRLDGSAFREALRADPSVAGAVIHTLAQRLRSSA